MPEFVDFLQAPDSASVTGPQWLSDAGSFWKRLNREGYDQMVAVLDLAARVEREHQYDIRRVLSQAYPGQLSDVAFASQRRVQIQFNLASDGSQIILLPPETVFLGGIRFSNGRLLEIGRDFLWDDSRFEPSLKLLPGVRVPERLTTVTLEMVWWVDLTSTRFWSRGLKAEGLSVEDNSGLLEAAIKIGRGAADELSFSQLLGQIVGVPVVSQLARVEMILLDREHPVIVTTAETLIGEPEDTPTVAVGDTVLPGDFVFDSLRYHDCGQGPPPSWITSFKIPARYFSPHVSKPLEFANSDQTSTVTTDADTGRVWLKFPITGDAQAVEDFWTYVSAKTLELGTGFAELATGHPRPVAGQVPAEVNPLRLMWQLRLRLGTSVSVIRRKPTLRLLRKLGFARRCLPPWLTHIFHFDQPVPEPYNELC